MVNVDATRRWLRDLPLPSLRMLNNAPEGIAYKGERGTIKQVFKFRPRCRVWLPRGLRRVSAHQLGGAFARCSRER